jgi:hypothetical protein
MNKPGSPSAYRDELAAAQARVALLEERLAEKEAVDAPEDRDPVIAPLLDQRRDLARAADPRNRRRWWIVGPTAAVPLLFTGIVAASVAHPHYGHLGVMALVCVVVGLSVAGALNRVFRSGARLALPVQDAQIAAARRRLAIEQALRTQPRKKEAQVPRARIAVEDEVAEEEADEEPAPVRERAPRTR